MVESKLFVPSAKPVHLVKNFHEVPTKKITFPLIAQEKHDGCYAFAVIKKGDYRIFSRTGKSVFKALKHLSDELRKAHENSELANIVLIFEVVADNLSAAAIAGRCQDETNLFPEAYAVVHDCIPYKDFVEGYCAYTYDFRYHIARSAARKLNWKYSENTFVNNIAEAQAYADAIIDRGGEGAVFKKPEGTWQAGKKDHRMMKIKQELSYDLRVTGLSEGAGKYTGTTGTINCFFRRFGKADGEVVGVAVSGMSDAQRDAWWNDPTLILGQIVQVNAMRFTEFGMLREPRYKGVRFDKDEADIV